MKIKNLWHILNCIWFKVWFWAIDIDREKQQGFYCNICKRHYP